MSKTRTKPIAHLVFILVALAVTTFRATPSAEAANGSWEYGPAGFSAAWTPAQRLDYIVDYGIADPAANYWTPFWSGANASNVYTGVADTGLRNSFAINHDINARYGVPVLGYLDIVTPLLGTNHLEIAATVSSIWNAITEFASSVWNSFTSLFESEYESFEDTGSYSDWGDSWDNGFESDYGGYGYGGAW